MRLPFTLDQFLDLFQRYNEGIGFAPIVLTLLGAAIVGLLFTRYAWRHRVILVSLAILWLWSGVVYQWTFFTQINPAAWLFGAVFILQAHVLAFVAATEDRITFEIPRGPATVAGFTLIVYSLVAYPLVGWTLGHGYPAGPSFGAPCPTTIFFIGMMLLAVRTTPRIVFVLPLLWTLVGTSAAVQLGMREDFALVVAAVVAVVELTRRRTVTPYRVPRRAPARGRAARAAHP